MINRRDLQRTKREKSERCDALLAEFPNIKNELQALSHMQNMVLVRRKLSDIRCEIGNMYHALTGDKIRKLTNAWHAMIKDLGLDDVTLQQLMIR